MLYCVWKSFRVATMSSGMNWEERADIARKSLVIDINPLARHKRRSEHYSRHCFHIKLSVKPWILLIRLLMQFKGGFDPKVKQARTITQMVIYARVGSDIIIANMWSVKASASHSFLSIFEFRQWCYLFLFVFAHRAPSCAMVYVFDAVWRWNLAENGHEIFSSPVCIWFLVCPSFWWWAA